MFLDKLWVREGEDVTVKMLVAHDTPPISFYSLEFRTVCNDLDGDVAVRCIQASATSRADYLLGPPKTMNAKHWTQLLQANPRLTKLDVHVVMEKFEVKSSSSAPWNPKNDVRVFHIYCAENQEDQVNKVLCSIYNKNCKYKDIW